MSWWSVIGSAIDSVGSDIHHAFTTVYKAVVGAGSGAITEAEKVGGQIANDASTFTTSIFLNWFFTLIIDPIVNAIEWVMEEAVGEIMKGLGTILGLIFALPDGLVLWFTDHITNLGIASPIALSLAIGIILVISIAIGLALLKAIQLIVQEA